MPLLHITINISEDAAKKLREIQSKLLLDGELSSKTAAVEHCIDVAHAALKKGKR